MRGSMPVELDRRAHLAGDADVDHGRTDLLDQRREAAARIEVVGDHRGAITLPPQRLASPPRRCRYGRARWHPRRPSSVPGRRAERAASVTFGCGSSRQSCPRQLRVRAAYSRSRGRSGSGTGEAPAVGKNLDGKNLDGKNLDGKITGVLSPAVTADPQPTPPAGSPIAPAEDGSVPPATSEDGSGPPATSDTGALPDGAAGPPPRSATTVAWTGSTYFAEGLPWSVLHQIAAEFFTAAGLPPSQVGYTSALHLTKHAQVRVEPDRRSVRDPAALDDLDPGGARRAHRPARRARP